MAKASDQPQKKKASAGKSVLTWTMTGMLILGLGGFGATNFGGTLTSIGSVGNVDLSANDYARAVQQARASLGQQFGMQLSMQDALSFGLDRQALADMVTRAALDDRAEKAGLSVGDATVAALITADSSFTGAGGAFDAAIYRSVLNRNGWKDREYEDNLRRDAARALIAGAITGGFVAPAAVTDALYQYMSERRGYALIRLSEADLPEPLAAPTEEELKAWYEANIADFTRPEAKRIAYARLLPEDLAAAQPADEEALRKSYEARIAQYVIPPRRLVERLIYPDESARAVALENLAQGLNFEALVAARGLPMDAVDMGDVTEAELGLAGEAVFAAAEGEIIAAETDLGPALFRINGLLPGEETSFEQARTELAEELQFEAARNQINDRVDEIDDLLAGGASLSELAGQTGMTEGRIDYVPGGRYATGDKLEGYPAFRKAADALAKGDFAEAIVLDDGGVVALEFIETLAPAPIPFDEARSAVSAALQSDRLAKALAAEAARLKDLAAGGSDFASLGAAETVAEITREGSIENAPAAVVTTLFTMSPGEIRVIEEPGFTGLLRLDSLSAPATDDAEAETLKAALDAQIEQGLAQDAFAAFADTVSAEAGISLDQNAVNLVNSSLQ